jgi:aspartate carbamoyltransferase regulatory subunit
VNELTHRPEPGPPGAGGAAEPTIKVAALREGTVIDHLPAGTALKVLSVLGIKFEGAVTIGLNLDSAKLGRKDIIKIERREVTPQEVAKIALISPRSSFSIIRDFQVARSSRPRCPRRSRT